MREIIFRGKRIDNGEWVEGFYISHLNACHYIIPFCTGGYEAMDNSFYVHKWFEVNPSTVGQYTGLKDKHGKRIFEGDILKWNSREWGCDHLEIANWDYELLNMRRTDWEEWCEVIGNVHDNPELIKEEAQT